jgi:hypothetical protein
MKKRISLLILSMITIIAIIGMVKVINTETTGMLAKAQKAPYSGYGLVTTTDACTPIVCNMGEAFPVGVDERGHIICQCREDPDWLQYRVTPFRVY